MKINASTPYFVLDDQLLLVFDNEELRCNDIKNRFYLQLYRNMFIHVKTAGTLLQARTGLIIIIIINKKLRVQLLKMKR